MADIKIKVEVENVEALESLKQLEYQFISAAQELRGGFIVTAEASKRLQRVLIQLAIKERKWYQFWKKNYKWTKK